MVQPGVKCIASRRAQSIGARRAVVSRTIRAECMDGPDGVNTYVVDFGGWSVSVLLPRPVRTSRGD
jgi:hypothetical protein